VSTVERLHPTLRYVIASNLGWMQLRPVQEGAIPPILDGATTVVVAPTAGGKTEAAMLPLLSRVLDERWAPISIVYVAPLRALLNDLGQRIGDLAAHVGLSVAIWHGDTNQLERRRIVADPPDVLLTTPESLEVLLSLASDARRSLLSSLRVMVIDEAHAFYGSDRGTHLLALIERLQHFAAHDLQRIALSATVGNPEDLLRWLVGTSRRAASLVTIARAADRSEAFEVCYREGLAGVATEIERFAREKVIVFCRTRSDVEELAHALTSADRPAWAHHSALSRRSREDAEIAFRESAYGALVATSTLELGIDIGDLDRVVQVDAPQTVSAVLQRLGRTGRRGGPASMTFVPTNGEQLALAIALLMLHRRGWVEPLVPPWRPFPILAQQILATILQHGGIARTDLVASLSTNAAFARITLPEIDAIVDHLLSEDVLETIDGSLGLGETGERRYGHRSFMDLASVFTSSQSVTVQCGDREIGTLDRWFIDDMLARDRSSFLLSGQAWDVVSWPDAGSILAVREAPRAEAPLFMGGGVVLGFEVMQAIRTVLATTTDVSETLPLGISLSDSTRQAIDALRRASEPQRLALQSSPIVQDGAYWICYTYAGLRANRLLADLLFQPLGETAIVTNTSIKIRSKTFAIEAFSESLRSLASSEAMTAAVDGMQTIPRVETKFDELVSPDEFAAFARERAYDLSGATTIAKRGVRVSVAVARVE
jgi:ATP-dependent Lhr-like helicase